MQIPRIELNRKLIHLSSLWMPLAIYFLSQREALILFGALAAAAIVAQVLRRYSVRFYLFSNQMFASSQRPKEKDAKAIAGATYMLLGVLFTLLFSKEIALTAVLVLIISDTAAALVGQAFGRTFLLGKSVEGCAAFLISGICVVIGIDQLLAPDGMYYIAGLIAIVVAMLAELFSKRLFIDDNLSIPFSICMTMWLFL